MHAARGFLGGAFAGRRTVLRCSRRARGYSTRQFPYHIFPLTPPRRYAHCYAGASQGHHPRVRCIATDPKDPQRFYAGGEEIAVWDLRRWAAPGRPAARRPKDKGGRGGGEKEREEWKHTFT